MSIAFLCLSLMCNVRIIIRAVSRMRKLSSLGWAHSTIPWMVGMTMAVHGLLSTILGVHLFTGDGPQDWVLCMSSVSTALLLSSILFTTMKYWPDTAPVRAGRYTDLAKPMRELLLHWRWNATPQEFESRRATEMFSFVSAFVMAGVVCLTFDANEQGYAIADVVVSGIVVLWFFLAVLGEAVCRATSKSHLAVGFILSIVILVDSVRAIVYGDDDDGTVRYMTLQLARHLLSALFVSVPDYIVRHDPLKWEDATSEVRFTVTSRYGTSMLAVGKNKKPLVVKGHLQLLVGRGPDSDQDAPAGSENASSEGKTDASAPLLAPTPMPTQTHEVDFQYS